MKAKDALAKCQQTIKSRPKQVAAIAVTAIIAVVLVCAFCLRGCDSNDAVGEGPAGTASQTSNDSPLNATAIETGLATMDAEQGVSPNEEQNADAAAGQSAAENGFAGSDSQSAGNGPTQEPSSTSTDNSNPGPSGGSNSGSSSNNESTPATPSKQWVVNYTQVWVQDSAAWDESIPTYGYKERSICNVCGADITGNEVAHGKAHMMAGEDSGHHTEMVQVVTGSQTVHHDATGHYETVESGGHWG
ncbi:hypothetical protein [Paraeggerthella sp.]|uniref:hypothetical protein n=1 Tax=Paraeggerthella sp. TaxID=2897350 RepID=UPI003A8FFE96